MDIERALETVALAEQVAPGAAKEGDPELDGRLEERVEEWTATVEVLLGANEAEAALRLVGSLSGFCQDRGLVALGRRVAQRALEAAPDAGTAQERARAWLTLGELAFRQGDQAVALEATQAALDAAHRADDRPLVFGAQYNLARIAFRDGDAERIRRHADEMFETAGEDLRRRCGAIHMLAWSEYTAGNVDRAVELFEENVEVARAADRPLTKGSELLNLGSLAIESGNLHRAADFLARGLYVAEQQDSHYLLPGALADIGRLAVLRGRPEPGLQLIAAGERQYELVGLAPDPGDDAFLDQRADAVAALGPQRAEATVASGRALGRPEAIALGRAHLADS